MADDPMDSDSCVGSKRRITTGTEQEEEITLLQLQLSYYHSEISTHHNQDSTFQDHQQETNMEDSSPEKKAKCFSLFSEGNQELGLRSSTEKNVSLSGSFEKEKMDNVENKDGSFGVQEVDSLVKAIEGDKKEHLGTCLEFEEKMTTKGKALESENVLEDEKKLLLGDLEVGKIFGAKTCTGTICHFATNSSKIDVDNNIGGIKGLDLPVRGSLKIEVIDDTALIGSFPLCKTGNGSVKDEKKKGKQEVDGKKAKRSRRKGKNAKKVFGEAMKHMDSTTIVEVENGRRESQSQSKIMYSRKELEALRFAKAVEQQYLWRHAYNDLGTDVIREYEDLASWKHQKNIILSSDTHHLFGWKAGSPAIMNVVAGRGARNGLNIFVH
ncbi:uncharacterized protein LOC111307787 isoform X2 [Durio zibethinus]|uniref:Uncharacterized protein LOC111307787 isoform X2 n=1 Tax=Durio zibethinus TaxID=66656 RepID=A0A6P6AA55_DURZI|nr:uncharacterized protein LOC111307787 isoform X2 [Durio zibethinus]